MRPMYRIAATVVCGTFFVFGSAYAQSNYGGYKKSTPIKQQTVVPAVSAATQTAAQAQDKKKLDDIMAAVKEIQNDLAEIKSELVIIRTRVTQ